MPFDIFLMRRIDGVVAIGFTNSEGVVDEIRIDSDGDALVDVQWRRDVNCAWTASIPLNNAAMITPADSLDPHDRATIANALNFAFEPGTPIADE